MGSTIGARTMALVGGVVLARALGAEQRGTYAWFTTFAGVSGVALGAGLNYWLVPGLAGGLAQRVALRIIGLHLCAVSALATAGAVVWITAGNTVTYTVLTALLGMFVASAGLANAYLFGSHEVVAAGLGQLVGQFAFLSLVVGFVIAGGSTAPPAIAAACLAPLAVVGMGGAVALRHASHPSMNSVAREGPTYRKALARGLPGMTGDLLHIAAARVDIVLVGALLSRERLGVYSVAVALSEAPLVLADAVSPVALTHMSASGDRRQAAQIARSVVLGTVAVSAPLAVLVAIVMPVALGQAFVGATVPFLILLLGTAISAAWRIVAAATAAEGRNGLRVGSNLSALIGLVALGLVLTPPLGLHGAAIASVVAQAIALAYLVRTWDNSGERLSARDLVPSSRDVRVAFATARAAVGRTSVGEG
jgi:O-antigen/teichoic acid export membrane protein